MRLKQEISLLHGVCLIVGNMIGSGIFVSPKVRVSAGLRGAQRRGRRRAAASNAVLFQSSSRGCCSTRAPSASRWWCGPLEGSSPCLEPCATLSWAPPYGNRERPTPTFWRALEAFWPSSGSHAALVELSACAVFTVSVTGAGFSLLMLPNGHLCRRLWTSLLIVEPACQAVIALTFSNYLVQPFYPTCSAPYQAVRLLAAAIICELLPTLVHLMFSSHFLLLLSVGSARKESDARNTFHKPCGSRNVPQAHERMCVQSAAHIQYR